MAPTHGEAMEVGPTLGDWKPPKSMNATEIIGKFVKLVPLSPDHAEALHSEFARAGDSLWTYMTVGPFTDSAELKSALDDMLSSTDWSLFTIMTRNIPTGFLAYLRDQPGSGVIEIGSIVFGPSLQRTAAATEAVFLLIDHAFTSGYRRVEWKCDDLNMSSRRSADRFGFTYEGTFRQATHYKARNRDTAWYSIIDSEWPQIRAEYLRWLAQENFDQSGHQKSRLAIPSPQDKP